jgi:hypothetical protein
MFSIPLYIFLIPYAFILFIFALFSLINLFHLVKFGEGIFADFIATAFYLSVSALIVFVSWRYLSGFNWKETIDIGLPTAGSQLFGQ